MSGLTPEQAVDRLEELHTQACEALRTALARFTATGEPPTPEDRAAFRYPELRVDWQPSGAGLTPDAMLFAAGRASARWGKLRLVWALATVCLALSVGVLGVWLASERSERLALLHEMKRRPAEPAPGTEPLPTTETPAPDGYLALRRQWEEHPGEWTSQPGSGTSSKPSAAPERPILRAWQPNGPPDLLW